MLKIFLPLTIALLGSVVLFAQPAAGFEESSEENKAAIYPVKTGAAIEVDGLLDETVWQSGKGVENFWQFFPRIR